MDCPLKVPFLTVRTEILHLGLDFQQHLLKQDPVLSHYILNTNLPSLNAS